MIDTTELRRLRDADGSTEWAYLNFVEYACENAHAIADELDALRADNRAMQNRMSLTSMAICSGDESDDWELTDQRWTAKAYENAKELDALRKRVAEFEAALTAIKHHRANQKDYCREIVAMTTKALEATGKETA